MTFINLSKEFGTLNHNLLVAKLKAYSLNLNAVSFIKSYLTNRYQRCKIEDSFSEWERIIAGVPQGSVLGPLLFNIFINNIFLYIENSYPCNYADDSTLYASGKSLSIIIENPKANFFRDFQMITQKFYGSSCTKQSKMLLGFKQNKLIMPSFIKSQFSYCMLIWVFYSRTSVK